MGQNFGQLGTGDSESIGNDASSIAQALTPIDLGTGFILNIVAGGSEYHHCALSVDARLKCWGDGDHGVYFDADIYTVYHDLSYFGIYIYIYMCLSVKANSVMVTASTAATTPARWE